MFLVLDSTGSLESKILHTWDGLECDAVVLLGLVLGKDRLECRVFGCHVIGVNGQDGFLEVGAAVSSVVFERASANAITARVHAKSATRQVDCGGGQKTGFLGDGCVRKSTQFQKVHDHVLKDGCRTTKLASWVGAFLTGPHEFKDIRVRCLVDEGKVECRANPTFHALDLVGSVHVIGHIGNLGNGRRT